MEQNNNMSLADNEFGVNAAPGDVDVSLLQAFLENNDYEHPIDEAIGNDREANLISSTTDDGDFGNSQSGADAAFEQAIVDALESYDGDLFQGGEGDIDDEELFGSDDGLDEMINGDAQTSGTTSPPVQQQLSTDHYAPPPPAAASQQTLDVSQYTAPPVDTAFEQHELSAADLQISNFPELDLDFDFNADPSNLNFDLNDLLPLEEHDLPEDTVVQEASVSNAEAVLGLSDEQLAELLETDLSNLPPIYDDQTVDIDTSAVAVAVEPSYIDNPPPADTMSNEEPISTTLPELQQHGTDPGLVSDNAFLQSDNATVGGGLPPNNQAHSHNATSTNLGPSHINSPAVSLEIPAPSYTRRRTRDEFENEGYFASQPSQPSAKKSRQHYEQMAKPGGLNSYVPTLNPAQQTYVGNASSGQPGGPVITPVELPPRQAAQTQRLVGPRNQRPPVVLPQIYNGYQPLPVIDRNWGVGTRGRQLFQYTDKGEWVYGQVYSARQIKKFICGENGDGLAPSRFHLTIWIQSTMHGHNNRYPQPVKCRWDDCPVRHRTITQGQYRVCFDEHADTSGRTTDPFHNTGYMHLYCFERCAPLISLIKNPPGMVAVKPDNRRFPNLKENGNPMQLGGSSASHSRYFIDAYNAWVEQTWPKWQTNQMTSRDTLYYTLADLHLRMFPNRQATTAHLRDYMGDLERMQELRDKKGNAKTKRNRAGDDEEEEGRPRQRVKTQRLGQPQSAAPLLHGQQHSTNGYETYAYAQGAGRPANYGRSQHLGHPQRRPSTSHPPPSRGGHGSRTDTDWTDLPAEYLARYDGYTQAPPPAPNPRHKRPRADNDDGTYESGRQEEYDSSFEPHTPKRVKVSMPSAPCRQHNPRYDRSSQSHIMVPHFQPNHGRQVNLPMLDDPFVVDPRSQVNPRLSIPSSHLNLAPDPYPAPNANSFYSNPTTVPGFNADFLAPEQGLPQPAIKPTRYSELSDIDIENWMDGTR